MLGASVVVNGPKPDTAVAAVSLYTARTRTGARPEA